MRVSAIPGATVLAVLRVVTNNPRQIRQPHSDRIATGVLSGCEGAGGTATARRWNWRCFLQIGVSSAQVWQADCRREVADGDCILEGHRPARPGFRRWCLTSHDNPPKRRRRNTLITGTGRAVGWPGLSRQTLANIAGNNGGHWLLTSSPYTGAPRLLKTGFIAPYTGAIPCPIAPVYGASPPRCTGWAARFFTAAVGMFG